MQQKKQKSGQELAGHLLSGHLLAGHKHAGSKPEHAAVGKGEQAWAGVFLALLDEQLACLQELGALAAVQRAVIDTGDADALVEHMDKRQAAMRRVESVAERMGPPRAAWDDARGGVSRSLAEAVEGKLRAITDVAHAIAAKDAADQAVLEEMRAKVAGELAELQGGQRAVRAYGGGGGGGATYQDHSA